MLVVSVSCTFPPSPFPAFTIHGGGVGEWDGMGWDRLWFSLSFRAASHWVEDDDREGQGEWMSPPVDGAEGAVEELEWVDGC
jgi:hypothetical protein